MHIIYGYCYYLFVSPHVVLTHSGCELNFNGKDDF